MTQSEKYCLYANLCMAVNVTASRKHDGFTSYYGNGTMSLSMDKPQTKRIENCGGCGAWMSTNECEYCDRKY